MLPDYSKSQGGQRILTKNPEEIQMELPGQHSRWEFAKVLLEERGDSMDAIVLISSQEIYVALGIEAFLQPLDNNIGATQTEDSLF